MTLAPATSAGASLGVDDMDQYAMLAELSAAGLAVAEAVNALHAALLAHDDSDDAHDRYEDAYEMYALAQRR